MRKLVDSFIWGFLIVFSMPTVLIVASWNSLPGEALWSLKLVVERSLAFLVSPSYVVSSTLQVKYTERRFSEAKRLLSDRHSVVGLPYLTQQVVATKTTIEQAPDAQAQVLLSQTYIATLREVSAQLEQQKQAIITGGTSSRPLAAGGPSPAAGAPPSQAIRTKTAPTVTRQNQSANVAPTPSLPKTTSPSLPLTTPAVTAAIMVAAPVSPQTAVVALQITQAQQTISETIQELEKKQHGKGKEEKDEEKDDQGSNSGGSGKSKGKHGN